MKRPLGLELDLASIEDGYSGFNAHDHMVGKQSSPFIKGKKHASISNLKSSIPAISSAWTNLDKMEIKGQSGGNNGHSSSIKNAPKSLSNNILINKGKQIYPVFLHIDSYSPQLLKQKAKTTKNTTKWFDFGPNTKILPKANNKGTSRVSNKSKLLTDNREGRSSIKNKPSNLNKKTPIMKPNSSKINEKESLKGILKAQSRVYDNDKKADFNVYLNWNAIQPKTTPNMAAKTKELFYSKKSGQNHRENAKEANNQLNKNNSRCFEERIASVVDESTVLKKSQPPTKETIYRNSTKAVNCDASTKSKFYDTTKTKTTTNLGSKRVGFDSSANKLSNPENIDIKTSKFKVKSNSIIRFEKIENWKSFFTKLRDLEAFLSHLMEAIERSGDVYEVIRRYIDYMQDCSFNDIVELFTDERYKRIISHSFSLERWTVFMVFYVVLEQKLARYKQDILRVILTLYQNLIFYLKVIYTENNYSYKSIEMRAFKSFLDASVLPKNADFYSFEVKGSELLGFIYKANRNVRQFLLSLAAMTDDTISAGIKKLGNRIKESKIDESMDCLLDTFYDYFAQKGVVTMEYNENLVNQIAQKLSLEPPFINSPIHEARDYTLVLDLDETLIHYNCKNKVNQILLRPHVHHFLEEMGKYFEIIIFTAAQQDYADWVIDRLDKGKNVSYRLYRHHTYFYNNANIKDLALIGRDLERTLIVDNIQENFHFQKHNGISVRSWFNDPNDTVLLRLIPLLRGQFIRHSSKAF